jgi:hypothetical protein
MRNQAIRVFYPGGAEIYNIGGKFSHLGQSKTITKISTAGYDQAYDYIELLLDDGSTMVIGNIAYEFYQDKKEEPVAPATEQPNASNEAQHNTETTPADPGSDSAGLPAA